LCHRLWHKFQIGIFPVKGQHAFDIALGKALFFGQFVVQITGQTRDHRSAPALLLLAGVNQGSDIPIQADQPGIDGQHGSRLRVAYAQLDVAQQCCVIGGR